MNLISGQAEGDSFVAGGQTLTLPAPAPRDGTLILGVRPEHAALVGHAGRQLAAEGGGAGDAGRRAPGLRPAGRAPFTMRIDGTLPPPKAGDTVPLLVTRTHCTGSTPSHAWLRV
jgi:sn-glycerol 3-phosphate transport system ATP-binding protein